MMECLQAIPLACQTMRRANRTAMVYLEGMRIYPGQAPTNDA